MTADLLAWGGIAGALVVIVAAVKMLGPVRRRVKSFFDRMERANDVVLGSPAIPDPNRPGEYLQPAIPDIGVRMTKQETLLEQFIVGVVEEAKDAAVAAARSAEEARGYASATADRFADLGSQVEGLAAQVKGIGSQVTEWQNRDRVKAETATAVLHEVVRDIPPAQERAG